MNKTSKIIFTTVMLAVTAMTMPAWAEDDSEEVIKYRQKVMKSLGAHNGAASSIIKGKVSYKNHLEMHAQAIADAASTILALFPEDSDFGETRAKPEVWGKRAEFEKAAKNGAQAAADFLKAVKSKEKDLAPAYKKLGESCKECHKQFREKK
jgi:cytochrome c556